MSDPFRIRAQDGQPALDITYPAPVEIDASVNAGAGEAIDVLTGGKIDPPACPCDCSCHRNHVFPERLCGEPVFPGDAERQAGQPGQVICGWCLDVCEAIVDG